MTSLKGPLFRPLSQGYSDEYCERKTNPLLVDVSRQKSLWSTIFLEISRIVPDYSETKAKSPS